MFFTVGQSDQGEFDIFDKDEVYSSPRLFPSKSKIPREILLVLPEVGKCSAAPEAAPLENPGLLEEKEVRFRIEYVLTFDLDDGMEAEAFWRNSFVL